MLFTPRMTNDTPPAPIRLGIIGLGNMGSAHAGSILNGSVPGLQLTAVADINPARLEAYDGIAIHRSALRFSRRDCICSWRSRSRFTKKTAKL